MSQRNVSQPDVSMQHRHEPDDLIAHLLEMVGHDDALARRVAECFLALGNSLPQRLAAALAADQAAAAAQVAHEIKGMAAMLGAQRLAAAAAALEEPARRSQPPPLAALREEWQRVGRCLHNYLASARAA